MMAGALVGSARTWAHAEDFRRDRPKGTGSNEEVLQQRDEVGGRRRGVDRAPGRRFTGHARPHRERGRGRKDCWGGESRARRPLPGRGCVVLGLGDATSAATSLAVARRRLGTRRIMPGGAAGSGKMIGGLCRRVAAPTGRRGRAAATVPTAAAGILGSGTEAERLDVPVGAPADKVGHVGEQHQRRCQVHLSRRDQPVKAPHTYTITGDCPPKQAILGAPLGCGGGVWRSAAPGCQTRVMGVRL